MQSQKSMLNRNCGWRSIACAVSASFGLISFAYLGWIAPSPSLLFILMGLSAGVIFLGNLPAQREWPGFQWSNRLMSVSLWVFILYGLTVLFMGDS